MKECTIYIITTVKNQPGGVKTTRTGPIKTPPQGKPAMTEYGMDQLHVPTRLPGTRKARSCLEGDESQPDIYVHTYAKCVPRKLTHTHLDHEITKYTQYTKPGHTE